MKFIDFFAGVGGFTRGFELAGHECIGHCEFDRYAEASYRAMHTATDEQLKHLASLPKHKRQKEILKDEYLNGEWYSNDVRAVNVSNVPRADCWTFGAPCQDFSLAGRRAGLDGERSSLVREIFRILEELEEEDKPTWLIYENVKGMLSSNRGLDFLSILSEMDRLGYDAEWQIINSKWYVPQNRERVYVVGHYRGRSGRQVFPIKGAGGENRLEFVGGVYSEKDGRLRNSYRTYHSRGLAPCLTTRGGGNLEPHICFGVDKSKNKPREIGISNCITAREDSGVGNHAAEGTAIAVKTSGDSDIATLWSDKYNSYLAIRKLTPRECFRLQGWTDDYFEKAEFMNSNCQLYKQAGNGVTIGIVKAIGEKLWTKENL